MINLYYLLSRLKAVKIFYIIGQNMSLKFLCEAGSQAVVDEFEKDQH